MGNLSVLSGAPTLVLIYFVNLFLTNFGLNLYPAFGLFMVYGIYYIFSTLSAGNGLNKRNRNIVLLHLGILFYAFFVFYLFELGFISRPSQSWWSLTSLAKFASIIIASIAVIITPIDKIIRSIKIIKNFSYLMIFGSIWFYMTTPLGLNFFSSDELAGYRYNGGINSYIIAGQILIAGFISHALLNKKDNAFRLFIAAICFGFAVFSTKDRTSIGSMLIIFTILLYRSGFGISPFIFQLRKSAVLLLLAPISMVFIFSQAQNVTAGELGAYKSAFHRLAISIRSYQLFTEVFPIGGGPGSQTFLMNENEINAEFMELETRDEENIQSMITREIESFQINVGTGEKLSPHNTYVDFLVPFGLMGLFFVLCILRAQLKSLKRILFDRYNKSIILDSFAVSAFLFLMFSSLFNLWWFYMIFYRLSLSKSYRFQQG